MKLIALIAAASLALTACEPGVRIAKPSDTFLTCADEPAAPGDAIANFVSDEQDAEYKKALRGSWQDCYSKVEYLHDWFSKVK